MTGYTITGSTLTLGTGASVSVTGDATIGSILSGSSGLTKTGTGRLGLTGANAYSGTTAVSEGCIDFTNISLAGFGGGGGRNISVSSGAGVKRNAIDNAFLNRLVETTGEITVMTGTTANNFDLSSGTGANLPNAFLGNWASSDTAAAPGADIVITRSNKRHAAGIDKVEVKMRRSLAVGGKLFTRLIVAVTP